MKKKISKVVPYAVALSTLLPSALMAATQPAVVKKMDEKSFAPDNAPKGSTIKVLVSDEIEGAMVEVKGSYNLYDPRTGKKLEAGYASSSYYMHPTTEGIKWGSEFPGVFQVAIVPDNASTKTLVGGTEYRGMVFAYQVEGTLAFVNEVSLDDYASSIVADRIGDEKLSKEAIAALAIAARSDGLYKSRHGKAKLWHVKAEDVGYHGSASCRFDVAFEEAFKDTEQMVLASGQPVQWFDAVVPTQEVQQKADAGKEANVILAELLRDNQIVMAKK